MSKPRMLVVLHGWSDEPSSFHRLVDLVKRRLAAVSPVVITLADYMSMDDAITYDDLVAAMSRAWREKQLPEAPGSVDIIAHSTGALVVRHWMTKHYAPDQVPIKHLLLLAPANFGSHLAHKGRAFYGRVIRGLSSKKPLQVGEQLLRGLELASPYTWSLAMTDRFSEDCYYGPGKVLCTVLIGNAGNRGIAAVTNGPGSDGTVRIPCANLNCSRLTVDFNADSNIPKTSLILANGQTAFGVISGENHSTIAGKADGPMSESTLPWMIQALTVKDQDFDSWCKQLSAATVDNPHVFQHTIVKVRDQFHQPVADYFLEFYGQEAHKHHLAEAFHGEIIRTVHTYQADTSMRSFYLNAALLKQYMQTGEWSQLLISLTAEPELHHQGNVVGYRSTVTEQAKTDGFSGLRLDKKRIAELFVAHQTLLVDVILKREQLAEVFGLDML